MRKVKNTAKYFITLFGLVLFACGQNVSSNELSWETISKLPDREGFAGAFAGVSEGVFLVAGGANFPEEMPWRGGTKVWYNQILALREADSKWEVVGRLPKPIGYGVSLTDKRGLICIGGGDMNRNYRDVFRLEFSDKGVKNIPLPMLPKTCAMMSGVICENKIYVTGGVENPLDTSALNEFWILDLDKTLAGWQSLIPCPGPTRVLATMATVNGEVFLLSGANLKAGNDGKAVRSWLRDAWKYSVTKGWQRLPDLPRAAVAAPSPAPLLNAQLLVIGGDDGSQINFEPKENHPGFSRNILAYNLSENAWREIGLLPFSLVTTPCVQWQGKVIIPGGEVSPGRRSPQVWRLRP